MGSIRTISVRDLVAFLLRRGDLERRAGGSAASADGAQAHALAARPNREGYEPEVFLRAAVGGHGTGLTVTVVGRADAVVTSPRGVAVEEIKSTSLPLRLVEALREPDPLAAIGMAEPVPGDPGGWLLDWAQALCYAAMLAISRELDRVGVELRYVSTRGGGELRLRRHYAGPLLSAFLEELGVRYSGWASRAEEWERVRNDSLRSLEFPFPRRRPGQEELEAAVEGACREGERLFVQAPTGIGKTVAVLLPALRALAQLRLRRVFYLTPRGTTAAGPLQALELLRARGARIRSIVLVAKEKRCLSPGAGCLPAFCPHARGHYDRVLGALEDVVRQEALDPEVIEDCARRHSVCPHELSLDASEWCDLIIGDYNYVFDPRVALRRYLDPEGRTAPEQVYLIDEAHNLVDRAREMYSAEISTAELEELALAAEAAAPPLAAAARALAKVLPRAAEECDEIAGGGEAAGGSPAPPRALTAALEELAAEGEAWLDGEEVPPGSSGIRGRVFDLLFFRATIERFDSRCATLARARPADLRIRLCCLDPSARLGERLLQARASVLFSATLTPLDYHAAVLGGGQGAVTLALPSPFPRENLCVVMDRSVSTRYRERSASTARVARIVAEVARGRPGSYLVFLPSYEYLRQIHAAFAAPPGARVVAQRSGMSEGERREFLAAVASGAGIIEDGSAGGTLVGFAIMGGLFGESVDLPGEGLVGAVVIGVGLPQVSAERELIRAYYEESNGQGFAFAYAYPGMGRVLQAAGRVIRSETDRGVVVLVDSRFAEAPYRELLPAAWEPVAVVRGARELRRELRSFWGEAGAPLTV